MTELLLSVLAIYLALGVMTTIVLSDTSHVERAFWWETTLYWPRYLHFLFTGR